MASHRKALLGAALAIPMVLGGAGTAYAAHYQGRALPGSALAGVPVAGMTRAEVGAVVRERAAEVTVTVSAGGSTRTQHLADLGYGVDVDRTVDAVFAANTSWASYATSLVSSRDVDAVVTTDTEKVDAVVAEIVARADKVGTDASVSLAKDKKSFVVDPAVIGHTIAPASFQDVVATAARDLAPAVATVEFVDTVPAVTTEAAQQVADTANAIVSHPVVLSDGEGRHTATAAQKASWVSIPASADGLGAPTVDAAKVRSWVESVAKDVAVEPRNGLRYLDSAGTVRLVVTELREGRTVSNAPALAEAAVAAISGGKKFTKAFEYTTTAATWEERRIAAGAENLAYPAAEGEKWIDVDLSRHTMTAYVGAKVVYGPVSMVNGSAEKPTVTGLFHVYYKNPLMTMRGSNADGTNYETPDVPWSSFFHRGFALHGAPWRETFGYSASHGCVNLPVSVAKWVYDFAPVGTPVSSHH